VLILKTSDMFDQISPPSRTLSILLKAVAVLALPATVAFICEALLAPLGTVVEMVTLAPTFIIPSAGGFALGLTLKTTWHESRLLRWVWVLPLVLLVADYLWPDGGTFETVFRKQFVARQPDDEGWSQLLFVAPMMGGIGYAIGNWVQSRRQTTQAGSQI
jgi:hypothetical protein